MKSTLKPKYSIGQTVYTASIGIDNSGNYFPKASSFKIETISVSYGKDSDVWYQAKGRFALKEEDAFLTKPEAERCAERMVYEKAVEEINTVIYYINRYQSQLNALQKIKESYEANNPTQTSTTP